jgi:hypothetical protein
MTPKEKAIELYLQMLSWQSECHKYLERNIISISAKKCALIAVDEILDVDYFDMSEEHFENIMEYWEQVKNEIQKI